MLSIENNTSNILVNQFLPMGVCSMLWGNIVCFSADRWGVRGTWQGIRVTFTLIPTRTDFIKCSTQELADFLQAEISKEIDNGTFQPSRYKKNKPLHFEQYSENWLLSKIKSISHKTYDGYRLMLSNHVYPAIGNEYLPYINHEKLVKFTGSLDVSEKTKKNVVNLVYQILRDAEKSGYIIKTPPGINFSLVKKRIVWLDDTAFYKVLDYVPAEHRSILLFLRLSGCRPSEARALRKSNIKKDHIEITHAFSAGPVGQVLKEVKNKKEDAIPYYDSLRQIIESLPGNLSEWVFVNSDTGTYYNASMNQTIWNPYCKKALGYHVKLNNACRHSFGNTLAKAGVSIEVISKLLRHSDTSVTKAHYADHDFNVMKMIVDNVRRIKEA